MRIVYAYSALLDLKRCIISFQALFPKYPPLPAAEYDSSHLPDDITVVTAYFNLGTFDKGILKVYSKDTYKRWMKNYGLLNNFVVAFTDIEEIKILLTEARKHLPSNMTQVILIKREDFWAFQQREKIASIYQSPGYPRYKPNTVNPNYSCAMHAKYDALKYVIQHRMYHTKYVAWVDIGYFRENEKGTFKLLPPHDLKTGHIGFTQVEPFYDYLTPKEIIYGNYVWIAGGFLIGQPQYLIPFIQDYQTSVQRLLAKNIMSTDQQVLFIMYSALHEFKPRLPLQFYYHKCRCYWFFLGDVCRDTHDSLTRPFEKLMKFNVRYV